MSPRYQEEVTRGVKHRAVLGRNSSKKAQALKEQSDPLQKYQNGIWPNYLKITLPLPFFDFTTKEGGGERTTLRMKLFLGLREIPREESSLVFLQLSLVPSIPTATCRGAVD